MSRLRDAHLAGDCDSYTCPMCEAEEARERAEHPEDFEEHCDDCPFAGCDDCKFQGSETVVAQAKQGELWEDGDSKTAPGVALTNTGSLAHSSGTSREGMAR